jgi:hypothetical protein
VPDRPTGLSTAQRLALVAGGVAVLVVAYLLIQGSGSDDKPATISTQAAPPTTAQGDTTTAETPAPEPAVPTVRVVNGQPQGGVRKLDFQKGGEVRFRVVSDTADEIHVHGYDLMKDVAKGGSVSFRFPASIDGRFVVELEGRGVQIAELDVQP